MSSVQPDSDRTHSEQELTSGKEELSENPDWIEAQGEAYVSCPSCFLGYLVEKADLTEDERMSAKKAIERLVSKLEVAEDGYFHDRGRKISGPLGILKFPALNTILNRSPKERLDDDRKV